MFIEAQTKEIVSANILEVTAGTNSYQGGNYSHGGRTLFRLKDLACTYWSIKVDGVSTNHPSEIEIVLGGDCEAETFLEALEFTSRVLREKLRSTDVGHGKIGYSTINADIHE
ncbi:hypothetical protein [Ruficoccus sp. ZRK36]|uniref:hypothetical protein n=1 Tax=Ruficoccus sp. ZRK36 TaxID=2866311 RepID=UPI001C73B9A8|nr:hypothetical protein [Ruficoccus sp. ZRK36]QYY35154.1 hypothetical protein K0V07_12715 [Ruficoccus sp. ZRK36]